MIYHVIIRCTTLYDTIRYDNVIYNTLSCNIGAWIPFGDHPLNMERYRED